MNQQPLVPLVLNTVCCNVCYYSGCYSHMYVTMCDTLIRCPLQPHVIMCE